MTSEEYAIERIMKIEKENDTLRGLKNRLEEECDCLVERTTKLKDSTRCYIDKLEEIKRIVSNNLVRKLADNRRIRLSIDGENGTDLEKEDFDKLLKLLDLDDEQRKEASDEVPED